MCLNRDRRLDWTMADRWGCLVLVVNIKSTYRLGFHEQPSTTQTTKTTVLVVVVFNSKTSTVPAAVVDIGSSHL